MSTKDSPVEKLRAQARTIALASKASAANWAGAGLPDRDARIGVVMDDKLIELVIPWSQLHEVGAEALEETILRAMQEKRSDA